MKYTYPLPNLAYTRTYRFGMDHIAKLSHLAEALHKDQSEIVREAIDEYYARFASDEAAPETPDNTSIVEG
jgi:predicted transcriptional regulator